MNKINHIAVVFILLFLVSCGQVGVITGGDEDVTAPQIRLNKVKPQMGSINISPDKITIPFNEFISLNKPAENIRVTPDDVRLDYSIKNKSLVLKKKEGEWQPNTTYTIYMNRTVQDITESNDSIMAYVFSTGSYIDSLQTAIKVIDAYKGNPLSGITVGLYTQKLADDTSKVNARYFSLTDDKGVTRFNHIKDESFYVYAFDDKNRNNRLDATEKRAALEGEVFLYPPDTIMATGPIIELMPPSTATLKIRSNEIIPGAGWGIGFSRPLSEDETFQMISDNYLILFNEDKDSVTVFFEDLKKSGEHKAILKIGEKTDTITKKYFFNQEPKLTITDNLKNKKLGVIDTLAFTLSEPILSIDSSAFVLEQLMENDSIQSSLGFEIEQISDFSFNVVFEKKKKLKEIFLSVPPNAISGINYTLIDSLKLQFTLQKEKEVGSLIVEFDTIPPYGILYVKNQKSNELIEVVFDGIEKQSHELHHLEPGQYDFHYLMDEDRNGKWSTGNIFTGTKSEKIIWIPTVSTVRGNWEVKTEISLELQ